MKSVGTFTLAFALALVFSPMEARSQASGVQVSPDSQQQVVSKNVGEERWAITRAVSDGTVIGNVFFPGGGEPRFLWCEQLGETSEGLQLRCLGADRCPVAPCTDRDWIEIAEVTIPRSFFEVGGSSAPASSVAGAASGLGVTMGGVGESSSGVQRSPDGRSEIVSKNVGSERWAITRDIVSGAVTGNVFFPDGGDPQFVWCEERTRDFDLVLGCYGADRCSGGVCEESWDFLQEIQIPATFFSAAQRVSSGEVEAVLVGTLGDEAGSIAALLALDRGFTLRQVVRAILGRHLSADGTISTPSGVAEVPAAESEGVFGATPAGLSTVQQERPTPAGVYAQLLTGGEEQAFGVILALHSVGYSVEQISQAFYGIVGVDDCAPDLGCPYDTSVVLVDTGTGRILEPAHPRSALFDDPTPPADDEPPPWTFRGRMIAELTVTAAFGERYLIQSCPAEITFQPDGTIAGGWECSEGLQAVCPRELSGEPGRWDLHIFDENASEVQGTWSPTGAFVIDSTKTVRFDAPFEGWFDANGFSAQREFVNMFEQCDTGITSMVEHQLDLSRVRPPAE